MNKVIVFLVLESNKYVSILERNSNGTYALLANIYCLYLTYIDIFNICTTFRRNNSDIRIVGLGLVENKEFVSEEVDNVFKWV